MKKKPNNTSDKDAQQEGLKLMRSCPTCNYEFADEETIQILEQREDSHLVHITCPRCQGSVLAVVLISALGTGSVGVLTDLDARDAARARQRQSLAEDDVLDFYQFLEKHQATKEFINNKL